MISNLQIDFDYTEGKSNDCGDLHCCRSGSIEPRSQEEKAGPWGDFKCDIPEKTASDMLNFIKEQVAPDVVFWGGDSISPNLGKSSIEDNISNMKRATDLVHHSLKGIPVYPTLGDRDLYPLHQFSFLDSSKNEAFNGWNSNWKKFIKNHEEFARF